MTIRKREKRTKVRVTIEPEENIYSYAAWILEALRVNGTVKAHKMERKKRRGKPDRVILDLEIECPPLAPCASRENPLRGIGEEL